jgi:hypothetical protein
MNRTDYSVPRLLLGVACAHPRGFPAHGFPTLPKGKVVDPLTNFGSLTKTLSGTAHNHEFSELPPLYELLP